MDAAHTGTRTLSWLNVYAIEATINAKAFYRISLHLFISLDGNNLPRTHGDYKYVCKGRLSCFRLAFQMDSVEYSRDSTRIGRFKQVYPLAKRLTISSKWTRSRRWRTVGCSSTDERAVGSVGRDWRRGKIYLVETESIFRLDLRSAGFADKMSATHFTVRSSPSSLFPLPSSLFFLFFSVVFTEKFGTDGIGSRLEPLERVA